MGLLLFMGVWTAGLGVFHPVTASSQTRVFWTSPGSDSLPLQEVVRRVQINDRLNSFASFKNGALQVEVYQNGLNRNNKVNVKSISKSILGLIAGAAVDDRKIELNTPIFTFFPYHPAFRDNDIKKRITFEHLLTMSPGLKSMSYQYTNWTSSPNWADFVLRQEMVFEPGRTMWYSSGNSHLASVVLTKAVGEDLGIYAQRKLFTPLGITPGGWDKDPQGFRFGGNNMAFSTLDLVKIGRLVLQKGRWEQTQVLPEAWISEMTAPKTRATLGERDALYGYYWWQQEIAEKTVHFAWGFGGQYVFVIPSVEQVVVFTSVLKSTRTIEHNDFIYALLELLLMEPSGSQPATH